MSGMEKLPPLPPFCAGPFTVNRATNWIEGVDAFGGPCHMLDVRGWGYLTGCGTALKLPNEVAIKAQRETAQWVVDAMNAAWNRRTSDPAQIRADALREAMGPINYWLDRFGHVQIKHVSAQKYATDAILDIQDAILSLIATPLSPPAVDVSPAPDAGGNADPAVYLIRKYGGYYRPNCQGYTRFKEDAGRYTLAEAIQESHPNGPDGPRDGMTYIHEDDVGPFDAGGKGGV